MLIWVVICSGHYQKMMIFFYLVLDQLFCTVCCMNGQKKSCTCWVVFSFVLGWRYGKHVKSVCYLQMIISSGYTMFYKF